MTLPNERLKALKNTREFLRKLMDPKKSPRIPRNIRLEAYWCLKHYPWDWDLEKAAQRAPEIWGNPDEI